MDEEYIMMGMAAYGRTAYATEQIAKEYVESLSPPKFKENLHLGIREDFLKGTTFSDNDIAAAVQELTRQMIDYVIALSKQFSESNNLVYGGGVALNCNANTLLGNHYNNIWIMPNP